LPGRIDTERIAITSKRWQDLHSARRRPDERVTPCTRRCADGAKAGNLAYDMAGIIDISSNARVARTSW
jgi:hypothetical protein